MKQSTLRKLVSLGLLLVFFAFFSITAKNFLTPVNIGTIMREVAVTGLLAIGVSFCIISMGIDLSTGAVMGLSAMVASRLVTDTLIPIWSIVVIALLVGALCGLFNALLVLHFGLHDFIATFSSAFIFRGILYMLAYRNDQGRITTQSISEPAYLAIGGKIGDFYIMTFIWLAIVIASYIFLRKTRIGTYFYAVGTNRKSSEFSGISVVKIKTLAFVLSGLCAALAGVFVLAFQASVGLNTGASLEFNAIAMVVVGGVTITGGRGDTLNAAIGSIFMIMVVNALYKYGFSTEVQTITYGLVIMVMAMFDAFFFKWLHTQREKKAKSLEESRQAAEAEGGR